jgi:hypothetical protein
MKGGVSTMFVSDEVGLGIPMVCKGHHYLNRAKRYGKGLGKPPNFRGLSSVLGQK